MVGAHGLGASFGWYEVTWQARRMSTEAFRSDRVRVDGGTYSISINLVRALDYFSLYLIQFSLHFS